MNEIVYQILGEKILRRMPVVLTSASGGGGGDSGGGGDDGNFHWVDITDEAWWDQDGGYATGTDRIQLYPSGTFKYSQLSQDGQYITIVPPTTEQYNELDPTLNWWKGLRYTKVRITLSANGTFQFMIYDNGWNNIAWTDAVPMEPFSGQINQCTWTPMPDRIPAEFWEDTMTLSLGSCGPSPASYINIEKIEIYTDQHLIQPPPWLPPPSTFRVVEWHIENGWDGSTGNALGGTIGTGLHITLSENLYTNVQYVTGIYIVDANTGDVFGTGEYGTDVPYIMLNANAQTIAMYLEGSGRWPDTDFRFIIPPGALTSLGGNVMTDGYISNVIPSVGIS